uniref:Capsid protein n=1 Tax=Alphatorquevirus homin29 TaxID=3048427 RepID=A0AAU8H435_9VIRU
MAWWRYRRRPWRRWRRRRWRVPRRRSRRTFRRRKRGRYVSRWRRRRYRRRLRRGRRKRGRRRRRRKTLILRQWNPDVIRRCFITGWMPLIICGTGHIQFNFITHQDDLPPAKSGYGGNFTNITFSLASLYEELMHHRNHWSKSNYDLELVRYLSTTIKLYRHESVDYVVSYTTTGPFETNELSYMSTHPLFMLLSKKHVVVPSLKTKPRGKRWIKLKISPPKLMLNKWYFAHDFCKIGLFQLWATACNLSNPWLRSGTDSPCISFYVLKNQVYHNRMSNLAQESSKQQRKQAYDELLGENAELNNNWYNWQYTYLKPMKNIYYQAANETTNKNDMQGKTYNWQNYKTYFTKVKTKWNTIQQSNYKLVSEEYNNIYTTSSTWPPSWDNRQYLEHDCGIFSPYFLSPDNYTPEWHTAYSSVRYNPLTDRGIGNRICLQWCSEASTDYQPTKSKCMLQDLPLYIMCYGYLDYCIKELGIKSAWTDLRVAIRSPYTDPKLIGSSDKTMYIPISETFMKGDMPHKLPYIPVKWWFKWYPMCTHQASVLEAIVSCSPFMVRDQEANSWDITMGYSSKFLWGGSPLPSQPIDDPCQKTTHDLPDPDRNPPRIQIADPQVLGPATLFHSWDIRRGLINTRAIKRVSEYADTNEHFSTGVGFKRPRLDTPHQGQQLSNQEEDALSILRQLQAEQEENTSSEEEQAPQSQEIQKEKILKQLRVQRQQQQLLRQGIKQLLGDVLRLRKGVHWNPSL